MSWAFAYRHKALSIFITFKLVSGVDLNNY
jgi:hypothetical protein